MAFGESAHHCILMGLFMLWVRSFTMPASPSDKKGATVKAANITGIMPNPIRIYSVSLSSLGLFICEVLHVQFCFSQAASGVRSAALDVCP